MTYDLSAYRDENGRTPYATDWAGDVADLPTLVLHGRIESLGSHIGSLFTSYDSCEDCWFSTNPDAEVLYKVINLRLAALNEMEPRLDHGGVA